MFKFLRWYWRKAQAAAAAEILAKAQKYALFNREHRGHVEMERLERFIVQGYIMPSKNDDNPQVEVTSSGVPPVDTTTLGRS